MSFEHVKLIEGARSHIAESFAILSGGLEHLWHPMAADTIIYEDGKTPVALYTGMGIAEGYSHIDPLLRRWSRIRPELAIFQRGGTLAPAQAEPI